MRLNDFDHVPVGWLTLDKTIKKVESFSYLKMELNFIFNEKFTIVLSPECVWHEGWIIYHLLLYLPNFCFISLHNLLLKFRLNVEWNILCGQMKKKFREKTLLSNRFVAFVDIRSKENLRVHNANEYHATQIINCPTSKTVEIQTKYFSVNTIATVNAN